MSTTGSTLTGQPHVVGERCQPKGALLIHRCGPTLNTTEREAREQAYVPAEQPSPPQGARLPPAHAHPRRPFHPVLAPPQGPQEPRRLTARLPAAPVLPAAYRLTDGEGFRRAVRAGRRAGASTLVVHLAAADGRGLDGPPRVGFVVSRAVGNAVLRNRVQRRLRHLVRAHLPALPDGSVLVVRALPPAARASAAELDADLGRCLGRVLAAMSPSRQPAPATEVSQ